MLVNSGQATTFDHYVKVQQDDGTWVVAPVKQQMKTEFVQVQNADGTIGYISQQAPAQTFRTVQIVPQQPVKRKAEPKKDEKTEEPEEEQEEVRTLYTSAGKSDCYFYTRWLWCSCREPYHTITNTYVESQQWIGCQSVSDSHAMDVFTDVKYDQTCCQGCCNALGCCCGDMGTITLLGVADTAHPEGWRLEKIHSVNETFDQLQKIIVTNKSRKKKKPSKK